MNQETESFYDVTITETNQCEQIRRITLELRPEWTSQADQLQITNLNGGITNRLVACFIQSTGLNHSDTLLFRMYGLGTEQFISRANEIETMKLMKQMGLGPRFYARFNNGVCYEFLPGEIGFIRFSFNTFLLCLDNG